MNAPSVTSTVPAGRPSSATASGVAGTRLPASAADDESYWGEIQRAFDLDRTMINLNNGGVSPTPSHVLEAMIRDLHVEKLKQSALQRTRRADLKALDGEFGRMLARFRQLKAGEAAPAPAATTPPARGRRRTARRVGSRRCWQ